MVLNVIFLELLTKFELKSINRTWDIVIQRAGTQCSKKCKILKKAIFKPKYLVNCHKIWHGQQHDWHQIACKIWASKPLWKSRYEFLKDLSFFSKKRQKLKKNQDYSSTIVAKKMKFYMVNNVTFAELHAKFEQSSSPRGRDIGSQSLTIGIKWLKMTVFLHFCLKTSLANSPLG